MATSPETLLLTKGVLKAARAVYVYFISTSRNEWVDWNGNTDKVQRIWRSPFPSVESAQRAAEQGRTPGSTFYIRQSVALCLEFDLGLALIYQSDLQPLKALNKSLDDCTSAQKVFPRLAVAVRDSTSRFLYQVAYSTKDAPSLANFKQGEMLYARRASGSGNKRNGLAWTLTPEPNIPDTVLRLVGKIESLLALPVVADSIDSTAAATSVSGADAARTVSATQEPTQPTVDVVSNDLASVSMVSVEDEPAPLSASSIEVSQPEGDVEKTTREQVTLARVGQGLFRERLEAIEPGCRLTGLANKAHLRASHIKPWRDASDVERLDGNNGLLLSPHVDHLFDQGYISFADNGAVLLSPALDREVLAAWHLDNKQHARPLNAFQRSYMAYHRATIFKA